ncbi:hypothetical protein ACA910_017924 [Epithemia clementina (nom. ined.)]
MKIAVLIAFVVAAPSVAALQANYLSQLNGAAVNGHVNGHVNAHMNGGAAKPFGVSTAPAVPATTTTSFAAIRPSQELLDLFSRQVSQELYASQVYLSAHIWFTAQEYSGMAAWALEESGEEREHGLSILKFANKRRFPVKLNPLPAPKSDWQSIVEVWQDILSLEQQNSQSLLNVAAAADRCHDYASLSFLGPFHEEQIDAEAKISKILAKIRHASPELLRQVDHDLEEEEDDH